MGDNFWAQFIRMKIESINKIIDNNNNDMLSYFRTTFDCIRSATDENFRNLQGSIDEKIEFYRRLITIETEQMAVAFVSQSVALEEAANMIAQIRYGDDTETTDRKKLDIQREALDSRNTMTQYVEGRKDIFSKDLSSMKNTITTELETKKEVVSTDLAGAEEAFKVSMENFSKSVKEEFDSLIAKFGNQSGHREDIDSIKNFTEEILGRKWIEQFSLLLSYLDNAETVFYENIVQIQDVQSRTFQDSQMCLKLRFSHMTSFTFLNNFFVTADNIVNNI